MNLSNLKFQRINIRTIEFKHFWFHGGISNDSDNPFRGSLDSEILQRKKKRKKEKETFNRHLRKYRSLDGTTNPANNRKFETRAKLCLLRKNCFVSRVCTVKGFLTDWIPHRLFEWSIDNQYIGEGVAPIRPLLTVTTMSTNLRETSPGNSRFSGFFFPPFFYRN